MFITTRNMQLQETLNIRIHLLFRLAEIIDDGDNFLNEKAVYDS